MTLKTLYITLISYFFFLIPIVIIDKWYAFKGGDFSTEWQSVFQIVFYSIPIIGLGFLILLAINLLTSYMIRKTERLKRLNFYLLVALTFSLLPIIAFAFFDYLHRGRYFERKTFVAIFIEYSPLLIWMTLAIFLNWRHVIRGLNITKLN